MQDQRFLPDLYAVGLDEAVVWAKYAFSSAKTHHDIPAHLCAVLGVAHRNPGPVQSP